jgi:hypothetical protein
MLRFPRSGSFGPHGHRIDFCENTVFYHFATKAFCALRNINWIHLAEHQLHPVDVPQSAKCFYSKMVKYLRSLRSPFHKPDCLTLIKATSGVLVLSQTTIRTPPSTHLSLLHPPSPRPISDKSFFWISFFPGRGRSVSFSGFGNKEIRI